MNGPRGRSIGVPVLAIAIVGGVVAALAPPAPTGNTTIDAVFVAVGVALTVIVGARAPWWAVAVSAGAALAIALDPLLMVLAVVALGAALWVGSARRERPEVLAASAALALNVLARAELGELLGLSAIVGVGAALLLIATGIVHFSRRVRWLGIAGVGLSVLFVGAASAGFGYAAASSRHDLGEGLNWAEQGVVLLESGDFEGAADLFRLASTSLDTAHGRLDAPMASGAAFVPVLAQHRSAVVDMSGVGSVGAATVAEALEDIDLDALRTVEGRINLEALAGLERPLTEVRAALAMLQQTVEDSRSPWLVNRATYELDDFDESVGEHLPNLDNALEAIRMAPVMLGADGPRRYLMLFTTPSEARGLGGFVGNYAELTIDDGRLALSDFDRAQNLDTATAEAGARVTGQDEFLRQYGRFGFDADGEGLVGDAAFRNLPMTPNFPWVGEIAADLYTQTTGRPVDGVIAMDPAVVATLLRYTGPIQLQTLDVELTPDSALAFLLRDQYVLGADSNIDRIDALAEAASVTFAALLSGALPEPITLARDLGPLAAERRLIVWSADPAEQDLFERVDLAGEIPPLEGADGWSFTVTNSGGSKIDSFLERAAAYQATTDPDSGETTATLRVRLTNTAPADGLPAYVIGNRIGLPNGTSRLYVSFYSPLALTGVTIDGQPSGLSVGEETGWNVYSGFVDIPPGGTADIELQLAGAVERPDEVVTWEQPMTTPVAEL